MTINGGDISSSANVYAAQTVLEKLLTVDTRCCNGLGDIRASAFVSDRNKAKPNQQCVGKSYETEYYEMKGNQKQNWLYCSAAKLFQRSIGDW